MLGGATKWASIAALAGFLFGFDTAVISGAEQAVQSEWRMTNTMHGVAISAALWGTVVGALAANWPLDLLGRKKTLIWIGVLYTVSAIGSALAWDPASFVIFRLIGGLGVGASSVAAPAYISEIAPRESRGRLVALFQTMLVVGILAAYVSNYLIGGTGSETWRWMLAAEIVPAAAYLVATFFIPESPRWLLANQGRESDARKILKVTNPSRSEETIQAIIKEASSDRRALGWNEFFSTSFRKPILLALMIAFFNQASGINAIIYFAPRIFEISGAGTSVALLATVGIGTVNLLFTLIGLILIDRAGRKPLMYVGSVGYFVSLGMTAYGFATSQFGLVLPFILMFIAAHAVGQGAVIWVYISEIFPSAARAKGQSLGCGMHWVCAAGLTLMMPILLASLSAQTIFAAFAGLTVLQLFWVHLMMVETRGLSLEQASKKLSS